MNIKDIVLKCSIIGFGVLLYSSLMVTLLGDWAFSIHHAMFDITRHQFDIMVYGFIGIFKTMWIGLFVIPYIAIRWSEKKSGS